jgi:DNA-binding NarL/FixJ family response regulator
MRLLLAHDDQPLRRDLRQMLAGFGFDVVAQAPHIDAARMARRVRPDVTVIDLSNGAVAAVEEIVDNDPSAHVLVIAESEEDEEVLDALLAGASGYVLGNAAAAEIVAGVRAAAAGDALVSPAVATRLVLRLREQRRAERVAAPPKPPPLTARERDILKLLAQGRENSAIASELVISPATVKTHVAHLLDKLDLDNRVQAAVFAVRHGIV